jgi:hypothetical protein
MSALLTGILGAVTSMARTVAAIVTASNLIVVGIAFMALYVLGLLPSMPAVPDAPAYIGYVNWLFPVADVVGIFSTFIGLYVIFLGLRIILRWVKAL